MIAAPCEVTTRLAIVAAMLDAIPQTITVRASYAEHWPTCPVIEINGEPVRFLFAGQRQDVEMWLLTYRWVEGGGADAHR